MIEKTGYAFMYRGCGYIYSTKQECYSKISQLYEKDKFTIFADCFKYCRIEKARVQVDANKNLISYERLS